MAPSLRGDELELDAEVSARAQTVPAAMPLTAAAMAPRDVAPRLASVNADTEPTVPGTPPMGPIYPAPSPWAKPLALRSLLLGLLAAALLFAGLAIVGIALVWSSTLTRLVQTALMIVGGYLIAFGIAYVVSREPGATASHA